MDALLDTHAYLWLTSDESQLGAAALSVIKNTSNRLFLSIASEWEIAIKVGNGRLSIAVTLDELLIVTPRKLKIDLLPIQPTHLVAVPSLPMHHKDPFDRLLVAQSLTENLPFISADSLLDRYGIRRIW